MSRLWFYSSGRSNVLRKMRCSAQCAPHLRRRKPLPSNRFPSFLRNRRGPRRRIAGSFTPLYFSSPPWRCRLVVVPSPPPPYQVQDPGSLSLPGPHRRRKAMKWGFIDADGKVLIQPAWDAVDDGDFVLGHSVAFNEGLCGVRKTASGAISTSSGNLAITNQFDITWLPSSREWREFISEIRLAISTRAAISPSTRSSTKPGISIAGWQPCAPTTAGASSTRPERLSSSLTSRRQIANGFSSGLASRLREWQMRLHRSLRPIRDSRAIQ